MGMNKNLVFTLGALLI